MTVVGQSGLAGEGYSCPSELVDARRLVLVTAATMHTQVASLRLFERASPADSWHPVHEPWPAVVGTSGMAWGTTFHNLANPGDPIKIEGDKRTPSGVFRIGRSFGFADSSSANYLRPDSTSVCVDDSSSTAYNTITSRRVVGHSIHGEDMRRVDLYRHGLVIDYPTDRAALGGSCIFIHAWTAANRGTGGCVALSERHVIALQDFSADGTVIAILPDQALDRLQACLPGIAVDQ